MRTLRLALTAAVTLTALVGCSSASDTKDESETTSGSETLSPTESATSATTPTEAPTSDDTGGSMSGIGFIVSMPSGWQDATDIAKQQSPQVDIAMAESGASEFRTNFNTVQPSPVPSGLTDKQLAAQSAAQLKSITHNEVTPVDGPDLDGTSSLGQTSKATVGDSEVTLIQYLAVHDDQLYATTMTFETSRADEAEATLDEIIASWTWTT